MQRSINFTEYKYGHFAPMPSYVTTPIQAKNYARWAKGQGLCLSCHTERKVDQSYVHADQNCYAELVGSFRQVKWALLIRQQKLEELDLAQRSLLAFQQDPERRERLRSAHDKLASSRKAVIWIVARDQTMDELVDSCLGIGP